MLVELVGVMIAGAVVMGVTIAVLVAVLRADRRFGQRVEARQSVDELADQLRRDVHAAQRAAWDADARRLRLDAPGGGVVTYQEVVGRWERRVRSPQDEEERLAGAYRAPRRKSCLVEVDESPAGTLVHLTWVSTAEPHDPVRAAAMPIEFVAAVGRDVELLYP